MRVLVTGATGMLGASLVQQWDADLDVFATGRSDFPGNPARTFLQFDLQDRPLDPLIEWSQPDVIVHCAALTDVDLCEQDPDLAMRVNGESVRALLDAAPNARIVFISTDAVFEDGLRMATEKLPRNPQTVYGQSKAAGETHLMSAAGNHCVVRTTIVGRNLNPTKRGFADWIVTSLAEGREISLFTDALFTPISTWSLATELRWIIEHELTGTFHVTGLDPVSKYDFGKKVCDELELNPALIRTGRLADANFSAMRSLDQTLDSGKYVETTGRQLPPIEVTVEMIAERFREFARA